MQPPIETFPAFSSLLRTRLVLLPFFHPLPSPTRRADLMRETMSPKLLTFSRGREGRSDILFLNVRSNVKKIQVLIIINNRRWIYNLKAGILYRHSRSFRVYAFEGVEVDFMLTERGLISLIGKFYRYVGFGYVVRTCDIGRPVKSVGR